MDTKAIFQNKNIAQIKLSKFTLSLDFNDELSLMASDSIKLYKNENLIANWHFKGQAKNLEEFIKIMESPIDTVSFDESTGLFIFIGNYKIEISKPSDDYEYLHIMSKKQGIYIF